LAHFISARKAGAARRGFGRLATSQEKHPANGNKVKGEQDSADFEGVFPKTGAGPGGNPPPGCIPPAIMDEQPVPDSPGDEVKRHPVPQTDQRHGGNLQSEYKQCSGDFQARSAQKTLQRVKKTVGAKVAY
jgi:hypothetical protein